ncbi:MAG: hypothetical protein OEU26_00295 [Candidatus Tectomicrobia bacterium]|nr:hypothetical protein [Candidatus Tectomicrobia bacterium]
MKNRILVVNSYHRDYLWCQATQRGLAAAMLKYGYLDTTRQRETLALQDMVESAKADIRKVWMDTKRRNSSLEIAQATTRIMQAASGACRQTLALLAPGRSYHV